MRGVVTVLLAVLVAIGAGVGIEAGVIRPVAAGPAAELGAAITRTMKVSSVEVTFSPVGEKVTYNAPDRVSEDRHSLSLGFHLAGATSLVMVGTEQYTGVRVRSHGHLETEFVSESITAVEHELVFQPLLQARSERVTGSGTNFTILPGALKKGRASTSQLLGGRIELRDGYVAAITFELAVTFTKPSVHRFVESESSRYSDFGNAPRVTAPNPRIVVTCGADDLSQRPDGEVVCAG